MSDNTAILAGFTREVEAYASECDLHLFIKPDTDLDSRFKAYDADECEWVFVNGWMFSIETVAEYGQRDAHVQDWLGWREQETLVRLFLRRVQS